MNIHKRYQEIAKKYSVGEVLKTDLWNEVHMHLPIPADLYVEFDKNMVQQALTMGYNAIFGDIRFLPIHEGFDTVLDFSTIDHVEDYPLALEEYARVLHPGGWLVLVVWLGDLPAVKMSDWDGYQYYFPETDFATSLKSCFRIVEEEALMGQPPTYLKLYVCERL